MATAEKRSKRSFSKVRALRTNRVSKANRKARRSRGRRSRPPPSRLLKIQCLCKPPRVARIARATYERGGIYCGTCQEQLAIPRSHRERAKETLSKERIEIGGVYRDPQGNRVVPIGFLLLEKTRQSMVYYQPQDSACEATLAMPCLEFLGLVKTGPHFFEKRFRLVKSKDSP